MDYIKYFRLEEDNGDYTLILYLDLGLTEFADEFGYSKEDQIKTLDKFIMDFIKSNFPDIRINSIKLMVGTILVATITLQSTIGFAEGLLPKAKPVFNMTYAYFETGNQIMDTLDKTRGILDMISPTYFDLTPDGHLKITPQFDPNTIIQMQKKGYRVVPFLANHWDKNVGHAALNNRDTLVREIASVVNQYNLDGINVDIENLDAQDRDSFTLFVKALRDTLSKDKEVSVAVAANPHGWTAGWYASYDYEKLAEYSDYIFIMSYDEHYETGKPGPVASVGFVEDSIKYALNYAPHSQIVLGLPFFGRYWKDDGSIKGKGTSLVRINELIKKYNGTITFDSNSKSPVATVNITSYEKDIPKGNYTIWFENGDSILYKLNLIEKYNLKGAGSWSLHQATQNIWDVYNLWINSSRIFIDVREGWATAPILAVYDKGWMIGTRDFYFEPNSPLTRAQAATLLVRILELGKTYGNIPYFSDVPIKHWAYNDIQIAAQHGLMEGKGNQRFAPDEFMTREEVATLLSRLLKISPSNKKNNIFKDMELNRWSYPFIAAMAERKIFEGFEDKTFRPTEKVTRAQMAALLERIKDDIP